MALSPHPQPVSAAGFSVVWTRGRGCADLAKALGEGSPRRVQGDLTEACVSSRADLLVIRKLPTSFQLVSVAVPVDLEPGAVGRVVAAVSGGPHSPLAARVAARIAAVLEVRAELVCAYRGDGERAEAERAVHEVAATVPGLPARLVEGKVAQGIIDGLPDDALLVLGAPGGFWLQRVLFGTGARLRSRAPGGAVVVRHAPDRVYQKMEEPQFVGCHLSAAEALRVTGLDAVPVVDAGELVGLVRKRALLEAGDGVRVEEVMEAPVAVQLTDSVAEVASAAAVMDGDPVPVVDRDGNLVGSILPGRAG